MRSSKGGRDRDDVAAPLRRRFAASGTARAVLGLVVVSLIALACVSAWPTSDPLGSARTHTSLPPGGRVGATECAECHDSFAGHRMGTPGHTDCESCHGPGERHAKSVEAGDIRYPDSADCLACHGSGDFELVGWEHSAHAKSDVICSTCHDTHNDAPHYVRQPSPLERTLLRNADDSTRLCASCHLTVVAELDLPSHHPVREGMLDCIDCHSPHTRTESRLGGPTALCGDCHQEVMGPWIYEHPPVTEDCAYCHTPHGASADSLLEISQPGACISCHSVATAGAVHQPYAFTTRCTDCHAAVHGSYSDPHLRQ